MYKMNVNSIITILLLYINIIKKVINTPVEIDVKTNQQFINAISQKNDVKLNIKKEITINSSLIYNVNSSISKIIIQGESTASSIIKFTNNDGGLSFGSSTKEIEISNITISFKTYFNDNENIYIKNVVVDSGQFFFNTNYQDNNSIIISNSTFIPPKYPISYYIYLINSNFLIEGCKIYGNENILNAFLNAKNLKNNENYGELIIKDTLISGGHFSKAFDIYNVKDVIIDNSNFRELVNPSKKGGGTLNFITCTNITISNSNFNDNHSFSNGGSLNFNKPLTINLNNLTFTNSTAVISGSAISINSEIIDHSYVVIKDISVKDVNVISSREASGLFLGLLGYIEIDIENVYCDNIHSQESDGSLIFINGDLSMNIKNITANNITGNGVGALFINTVNVNDVIINAKDIIFSNSYINSQKNTASFLRLTAGLFEASNVTIINIGGDYSSLIVQQNTGIVKINNLLIDGYNSKIPTALFESDIRDKKVSLELNKIVVKNIKSNGVIISLQDTECLITNSEFVNIHSCYINEECYQNKEIIFYMEKASIAILNWESKINFENVIFTNVYGERGFFNGVGTTTTFKNVTIQDGYEKMGIFNIDYNNSSKGDFIIHNSYFINNKGINGNIANIVYCPKGDYTLNFYNSHFYNNYSSKFGGVIYSINEYTPSNVLFSNCEFLNNNSKYGNIAYSLDKNSEPKFIFKDSTFLNKLKSEKYSFVTNPTKLMFSENSYIINNILSGDVINKNIIFKIYDDYENKFIFGYDADLLNINELFFFEVKATDMEGKTENIALFGQRKSYCWEDSCSINNLKIVGIPGEYLFKLKLLTYGSYSKFYNDEISMKIKILECNETKYIYQFKEHPTIKSCYSPTCHASCNTGECINDNVCDCTKTPFTGLYCDEHYILHRNKYMDYFHRLLAIILIIMDIICMYYTIKYRNNPVVKGGSINFLIIILFGLILNSCYIFFISKKRETNGDCYNIYILKNIGFSLVFGSILVKTYRINFIFTHVKHSIIFKTYKMYMIIGLIILFHTILLIIWIIFKNLNCVLLYTTLEEEYHDCKYSKTKFLSIIFNSVILFIGTYLAYSIRYVNDNFKEPLAVPIYVYSVCNILSEIVDHIEDIPLSFKDEVMIFSVIIYTLVILYYLYIKKFITIWKKEPEFISTSQFKLNEIPLNTYKL
ncbi:7 transmembrane sweet-taste receptor of 3 GCPR-domain-containing protein [Neocallimastix sp. 'constans']